MTDAASLGVAFQEYDGVWVRLASKITADMLGLRPRCRTLIVPTTGLDHVDLDACRERGVEVISLKGEVEFLKSVRATAELTLALVLAVMRKIPAAATSVREGRWDRDRFRGTELFGKTVGIVGVGRLGSIVAGYFRAFGCEVLGYDPRPDFPADVARRVEHLPQLLESSDVICIMVSFDAGTRRLIGDAEFAAMKPGAVLLNASRGGVVDETALLTALNSGRLSGAALDVLDGEPTITHEHPLVRHAKSHDNLLIVPHIGGNTAESFEKTEIFLAEKLAALWRAA